MPRRGAPLFFDASVTGFYGVTTETAVRLFQMANGLPATGEADPAMLTLLCSSKAVTMEAVRESFREQLTDQGDTARDVIGTAATQARGRAFETDYEDKYEGFAFVRYICVTAGVPVVSPEDLMTMVSAPVENASETEAGDILAFCRGGSGNVRLAIATGEGRAVYATSDTGWVLESGINEMLDGELYRWNIGETLE